MYPDEVDVDEVNLALLSKKYEKAHNEINALILGVAVFTVANRKAILAKANEILTNLGISTQKYIEKEITDQYISGTKDAVKQLENVGAEVAVAKGLSKTHTLYISTLVDETSQLFEESLSGISRSTSTLLGKATREATTQKMVEGITASQGKKEVAKVIKATLQEQGLAAIKDKSGRTWSLDRYADMLFRTKSVEARNRGLINRMAENDYDLVQVSDHGSDHEECAVWEGKILSATGKTPGYDTVADAEEAGLFHPNCKHAINVLIPSLAEKTKAYDPTEETLVIKN